jgi:hypothetical protein
MKRTAYWIRVAAIIQAELRVPAMAIAAWKLKKSPPKRAFCTLPNFNSGPA